MELINQTSTWQLISWSKCMAKFQVVLGSESPWKVFELNSPILSLVEKVVPLAKSILFLFFNIFLFAQDYVLISNTIWFILLINIHHVEVRPCIRTFISIYYVFILLFYSMVQLRVHLIIYTDMLKKYNKINYSKNNCSP